MKQILSNKHDRKAKSLSRYRLSYIASVFLKSEFKKDMNIYDFLSYM